MPIVSMDRLTVVGLVQEREAIIDALMRLGALEIISRENENPAADAVVAAGHDGSGQIDEYGHNLSRLEKVIALAGRLRPEKMALFSGKRQVASSDFLAAAARETALMDKVEKIEHNQARLNDLQNKRHQLLASQEVLTPWLELDYDLSEQGTRHVRIFLGSLATAEDLQQIVAQLQEDAPETIIRTIMEDEAGLRCIVATWAPRTGIVQGCLRRFGFNQMPLQGQQGTAREIAGQNGRSLSDIADQIEQITTEISELATPVSDYEILHDYYQIRLDQARAIAGLSGTSKTFYLEGWAPSDLTDAIRDALNSRFLIAFASRSSEPGDSFPILLKNRKMIKPFEVVAEMFSPPSCTEIDPTPWVAPFYFFFFGIMLSDVGYGLLLTAICGWLAFGVKVRGDFGRLTTLLFYCGVGSTIWGFLFGGFFGDMLSVLSGQKIVFPAIWFNPMDDPSALMIWSMVFGVVHLFAGMWIKVIVLFKTGHGLDAILDVCPWYLVIAGLGLMIGGIGDQAGPVIALAGAAILVLFGGRSAKNPIARFLLGLKSLYDITAYFSDILSYTRILALVLATSVIAMVVNLMGFLLGPTIPGIIFFIVVALGGHALNLALSTLSAYVHTSRLHYVEFFGKFYEGGGRMWQPLRLKTRYTDIQRD